MLVLKKVFILFWAVSMIVCFIFWALSHAPLKKNKSIKKAKMRRWSTIFIIATIMLGFLFISRLIVGCSIVLSFILIDIACDKIIENL